MNNVDRKLMSNNIYDSHIDSNHDHHHCCDHDHDHDHHHHHEPMVRDEMFEQEPVRVVEIVKGLEKRVLVEGTGESPAKINP